MLLCQDKKHTVDDHPSDSVMRSVEEKLRAARATFGASSCHLLDVHSGADGAGREVPWADLIGAPLPGGGAGELVERPAAPAEARPVPL